MLLWAYSFLTYNLYNEYWDEYEPWFSWCIQANCFCYEVPPHFLRPRQTGAVNPLSSMIVGCPVGARDLQLVLTCFEFVFSVVGMVNASIHTHFIYLFLTSLSHN